MALKSRFYKVDYIYSIINLHPVMRTSLLSICIFMIFLFASETVSSQKKSIVIDEDLQENSDHFKVKIGTQWLGRIHRFQFGNYSVVKSRNGAQVTQASSNFWGTYSKTKSENKFSFILSDGRADSIVVSSLSNISVEQSREFNLLRFGDIEEKMMEQLENKSVFISKLQYSPDQNDDWKIYMENSVEGQTEGRHAGAIWNQSRTIDIIPVSSNRKGDDKRMFPALGYEFVENGIALGAVQYFGGGAFGLNKNKVWLRKDLDTHTKLVLAGAMTNLMQYHLQIIGVLEE